MSAIRVSRRRFVIAAAGAVAASASTPRRALALARRQPPRGGLRASSPHTFLTPEERRTASALLDALVPPVGGRGGALAARAIDYLDFLLGSHLASAPPLYHLGPFSGRLPYAYHCGPSKRFPPARFGAYRHLDRAESIAWTLRLEGSAAHPALDRNAHVRGPIVGWRDRYRTGLARLDNSARSLFGQAFADLDAGRRELVIDAADQDFISLAYAHAVEGTYSAPEYGGNAGLAGWHSIGFDGDRQPLGYYDPKRGCELAPLSGPDPPSATSAATAPSLDPATLWRIVDGAFAVPRGTNDLRVGASRRSRRPLQPQRPARATGSPRRSAQAFDAVIVGSGPGASMAALVLAQAGQQVLVLERGPNPYRALGRDAESELTSDELKAFQRGYGWPDPLTEPRTFRPSADSGARTQVGPVNDLPALVGGGAGIATMLTPRMREVDFLPHSRFGDVPGSILVDWPITYAELAPHYDAVERLIGVQGRADDPNASPRHRGYPLPPGPPLYASEVIAAGANKLGIAAPTGPLAITSRSYQGREGCNECGRCWHYGCPIGAHGGMAPTLLGRAVATGRCTVRAHSFVAAIAATGGRATGVHYVDDGGRERSVGTRAVVLGAGPIEDVRLMLLSRLGDRDRSGLLGRGLVFHFQTFAGGYFSSLRLHTRRGRGLARMITDFSGPATLEAARAWNGVPGGGVVEISGLGLFGPISEGQTYPRGSSHAGFMGANLFDDHIAGLLMQGEDVPNRDTVVDLDPGVVDFRGLPVARLTYSPHPFELAASSHYGPRLAEILAAAGAEVTVFAPKNAPAGAVAPGPGGLAGAPLPGGAAAGPFSPASPVPNTQHILSGLRMGRDPASSVCDPDGRLHGFTNLYCVDGGLFCSSTPVNPTLTIWALAHRVAGRIPASGRVSLRRRRRRRRHRQSQRRRR
jgi:choline dehydrogenase-like flavoprotein